MSEYESIRNEIISMEEQQRNVWIYMYVLFITLFILGIEWSYYLFLVTYIVLIPFQVVINRYSWSVAKMSTYIRIFYEKNRNDLNWESMHVYNEYREYYKKLNSGITGIIRYIGVTQLGFLATSFYISFLMYNRYSENIFNLTSIDIFSIIASLCLFFLTLMLNREYNKNYHTDLETVVQGYKNSLGKHN